MKKKCKLTGDANKINNKLRIHLNPKNRNGVWKNITKYNLEYLKDLVENKANFNYTIQELYTYYLQEISALKLEKDFKLDAYTYIEKLEYAEDYNFTFEMTTDLAVDLIYKAIGRNNRSLLYPIPIEFIISIGLHNNIEEENIDNAIWYFILFIAIAYFDLCEEKNYNIPPRHIHSV